MSENRRILREVIYLAHEGGYGGPGSDWDSASRDELDEILQAGEHIAVLQSEEFGRAFFTHIQSAMAVSPGSELSFASEEDLEVIEERASFLCQELAEADDPLKFLQKYLT